MMSENNLYPTSQTEPLLIVISGPSGVGKDSVIKAMKKRDLPFHFVVTTTSRPPREDEQHGVDYFFISAEEFAQMIKDDELLEHAVVYGDNKGISKEQVRQALASGKDVVMRIDVQGAATIRDISPEALLIFLTTQNETEMIDRLKLRKSETKDGLQNRIATARDELKRKNEFDYVVINRDGCLEEAVETILAIIHAEHHRAIPKKVNL